MFLEHRVGARADSLNGATSACRASLSCAPVFQVNVAMFSGATVVSPALLWCSSMLQVFPSFALWCYQYFADSELVSATVP